MTLNFLLQANRLKQTPRTGWLLRGVPNAENVAAHSYGVALAALVLAQEVDEPFNLAKVLTMALVHDLAEAVTSDIPNPAWRYLPAGAKPAAERAVLTQMLEGTPGAADLLALWEEHQANESVEARLMHDADRLDLYLQALVYEEQTGNRQLAEFWQREHRFHFPQAQAIYEGIRERRGG